MDQKWGFWEWMGVVALVLVAISVGRAVLGGGTSATPDEPPISESAMLDAAARSFGATLDRANAAVPGTRSRGLAPGSTPGRGTCPWESGNRYRCRFSEDIEAGSDQEYQYVVVVTDRCFKARLVSEPGGFQESTTERRLPMLREFDGCV